jgi:hypothetical protein
MSTLVTHLHCALSPASQQWLVSMKKRIAVLDIELFRAVLPFLVSVQLYIEH